jgi:hypothetical protein
MKRRTATRLGLVLLVLCVLLALTPFSASAQSLMPGNYCISCHTASDSRLENRAAWQARAPEETTCPAIKAYREDLLYTEQLLLATANAQSFAASGATPKDTARVEQLVSDLEALRSVRVTSLAAFRAQAQAVRYQGAKAYTGFNQVIDARKRITVLVVALILTAILLAFLGWGLRNTLRIRPVREMRHLWRPGWRTPIVAGLVLVAFALPVFRTPATPVETPTVEEQAVQAALDDAGRIASVADRGLARAWMLARVGAGWAHVDGARGEEALAAALAAEREAQRYTDALWGAARAAEEAAVGSPVAQEAAALRAAELEAVRHRAWSLRLIAAEWSAVDRERAAEILTQARARAAANPTIYGQIDLAATEAEALDGRQLNYALRPPHILQPGATVEAAQGLLDTLETEVDKAEVLRFIAATTGEREDFDRALAMAEAARVRGDALAPAEASLGLALAMVDVNRDMANEAFAQGYELASKISVKFP